MGANGNIVAGDEEPIFQLPDLLAPNHNGGAMHFDDEGYLYG